MDKWLEREWWTTEMVGILFGIATRQRVNQLAKREKWRTKRGRGSIQNAYHVADVVKYARNRQRSMLAAAMSEAFGVNKPKQLVRTKAYDIKCPQCGEFAMLMPPARNKWAIIMYVKQMETKSRFWACLNGHNSMKTKLHLPPGIKFSRLPWNLYEEGSDAPRKRSPSGMKGSSGSSPIS